MKCELNVWLWVLAGLLAALPTTASAAKANVKIVHEGRELVAYRGDGTQVHFAPAFDAFLDFEIPPTGGSATGSFEVLTELTLNGVACCRSRAAGSSCIMTIRWDTWTSKSSA